MKSKRFEKYDRVITTKDGKHIALTGEDPERVFAYVETEDNQK